MKRFLLILMSVFLTALALPALANNPAANTGSSAVNSTVNKNLRRYQIEMIIYSQINKASLSEEQWPLVSNTQLADAPAPTQVLPSSQYFLQSEAAQIANNPDYKLLLHVSWIQPLQQLGKKVTVRIVGGQAYDSSGNSINLGPNDPNALSPEFHWQVNGLISIRLTRFLDTTFNIIFSEPESVVSRYAAFGSQFYNIQNGFAYFQLYQNRRMKSRELNYIDYPLYGILIEARQV